MSLREISIGRGEFGISLREVVRFQTKRPVMRIPPTYHRRAVFDQTAMTPLIDIVFQLLIFFICATTGHMRELLLPADLSAGIGTPPAAAVEKPLGEVWIRLRKEQEATVVQVEGTDYGANEELARVLGGLAEVAPEIPVYLAIAEDVPLGDVVRVYDLCRAGGFHAISFAVQGDRPAVPAKDAE